MISLGTVYRLQGKYAEADKLLTAALQVRRRELGPENPDTISLATGDDL